MSQVAEQSRRSPTPSRRSGCSHRSGRWLGRATRHSATSSRRDSGEPATSGGTRTWSGGLATRFAPGGVRSSPATARSFRRTVPHQVVLVNGRWSAGHPSPTRCQRRERSQPSRRWLTPSAQPPAPGRPPPHPRHVLDLNTAFAEGGVTYVARTIGRRSTSCAGSGAACGASPCVRIARARSRSHRRKLRRGRGDSLRTR
jgi:hypothetical protein